MHIPDVVPFRKPPSRPAYLKHLFHFFGGGPLLFYGRRPVGVPPPAYLIDPAEAKAVGHPAAEAAENLVSSVYEADDSDFDD